MGQAFILWKWIWNSFSTFLDANYKIENSVAHAKKIDPTLEDAQKKGEMAMNKNRIFEGVICATVLCLLSVLSGCASFPTPNVNSFYNKDEEVNVKMLLCRDFDTGYLTDWRDAFRDVDIVDICFLAEGETKRECDQMAPPPGVAPVVIAAVGIVSSLAIDYGKKELKKEAENYVQQFGITYFEKAYWDWDRSLNKHKQKYCGFEIIRKAKRYDNIGEKEEVFKLVYGIAMDKKKFFWLSPIYFETKKAKAKVAPLNPGAANRINTKVELSIDSVWRDNENKYHKENIVKIDPLNIMEYDIEAKKGLRSRCTKREKDKPCDPSLKGGISPFMAIPISRGSRGKEAGIFWLNILVTESDASKTKDYVTDLSDLLDKNRDKIVGILTDDVLGGESE